MALALRERPLTPIIHQTDCASLATRVQSMAISSVLDKCRADLSSEINVSLACFGSLADKATKGALRVRERPRSREDRVEATLDLRVENRMGY